MFKGFRDFILRGNVLDLAVAVILGAAFNAIVDSLVSDVLNPLIAATRQARFLRVVLVHGGKIKVGNFFNARLVLHHRRVVYFCIVLPINHSLAKLKTARTPPPRRPPPSNAPNA